VIESFVNAEVWRQTNLGIQCADRSVVQSWCSSQFGA
jgi:hypothetical protein